MLLRRVSTAAVLIPLVLALLLWAPAWLFVLGLAPVVYFGLWEFLELVNRIGPSPTRLPVYLLGLLLLGLSWLAPGQFLLGGLVASAVLLLTVEWLQRPVRSDLLPCASAGLLGLVYVSMPLALAVLLRGKTDGAWVLFVVLLIVWAGDTAAFVVGRTLGRHKLAPRISPGKTIEGTVASLLAAVGAGSWFLHWWFPQVSMLHTILFPLSLNILAQLGDLVESAVKRKAGVKDSSALLPGHGGVLDRIDSLLFALPTAWYYWGWLL